VAISPKSDQVVKAVQMLDYGYSPEGHMFFNFGMEGVSYTMKGEYPQYTDLILRNPDKLAPSQALAMYSRASYFGPFVQDERYAEQYYSLPQQREAVKLWADTDADEHLLPPTPKTERENAELSVIMQDVSLLVDEMSLKLILGIEPMEAYDSYLDKIRSMRIDRALEIQEAALMRYNSPR
jgi:putative aldouronate transport system substrate-binding protein